jgi:hypothetical protein
MASRQRWLGVAGIVFVILVLASIFSLPNPPDAHASLAKVVSYYHKHKDALRVSTYLTEVAVFIGLAFFWYLREHLSLAGPASKRLSTLAFAGAVLFAVSGGVAAGISWALADAVDHVEPAVIQTLNVLNVDLTSFIGSAGIAVFLAANGVAIISSRSLPVWIGWAGIVLAVIALVFGFFGFIGIGLWILAASIVILLRADRPAPATATPTPTEQAHLPGAG